MKIVLFGSASIGLRYVWCLLCVWAAAWDLANAASKKSPSPVVVQGLKTSGLRISVPDSPLKDMVIINANINVPISTTESGKISGNINKKRDGYWTLETKNITVKPGDVVFYWAYALNGEEGEQIIGHQLIRELVDPDCRPSPTTVKGASVCSGKLIFEENFDKLDTSIWKHLIQFSDDPDLDFTTYTNDPNNSFVKDGTLHLKATVLKADELLTPTKLDGCNWPLEGTHHCELHPVGWQILPPTRSATLVTRDFSFRFGRVEIRAKSAAGDWLMSKLILDPENGAYGKPTYESGRVEIMRTRGNPDVLEPSGWQLGARLNDPQFDMRTCDRTLHWFKNCPLDGKLYTDDFHIFSFLWTPDSMTINSDGCIHEVKPPDGGFIRHNRFRNNCHGSPWEGGSYMAPFDKEFLIRIALIPGGWHNYVDGANSRGNLLPWKHLEPRAWLKFWKKREDWYPSWISDFEIDYVKVWAL